MSDEISVGGDYSKIDFFPHCKLKPWWKADTVCLSSSVPIPICPHLTPSTPSTPSVQPWFCWAQVQLPNQLENTVNFRQPDNFDLHWFARCHVKVGISQVHVGGELQGKNTSKALHVSFFIPGSWGEAPNFTVQRAGKRWKRPMFVMSTPD